MIRIPSRISPREAVELQRRWADKVKAVTPSSFGFKCFVGCDATYLRGRALAAAVLVDSERLELVDSKLNVGPVKFPYIPGLLAFREAPPVLRVIKRLKAEDYVCMVDGHGLAHPRRFGLACFVGVALDTPTIGVAKSLLYGREMNRKIVDAEGREIAEIVQLPGSKRRIYVSVGHKISLRDAVKLVMHCLGPSGPIPLSIAHRMVTENRWMLES